MRYNFLTFISRIKISYIRHYNCYIIQNLMFPLAIIMTEKCAESILLSTFRITDYFYQCSFKI